MKPSIKLGYPLDQLLDRKCKHEDVNNFSFTNLDELTKIYEGTNPEGSIKLPNVEKEESTDNYGTGNIVIKGKPGTAKSTLALQCAVSSVQNENQYAVYYSLEENRENMINKSKEFGWDKYCEKVEWYSNNIENESIEKYASDLYEMLNRGKNENKNKVYFPLLTHRHITESGQKLFWERYKEIEVLLASATTMYKDKEKYKTQFRLSFVIIDSINVFGQSFLDRNELYLLFELFKKYYTIGIFIVEETDEYYKNSINNGTNVIDYLADVVINLTSNYEDKYYLRYFEITKSRYQHQIYGIHPFKIVSINELFQGNVVDYPPICAIRIYPTLHYMVWATSSDVKKGEMENGKDFFNTDALNNIYLPPAENLPSIIMIEGPQASFKSTLARDFLLKGLIKYINEDKEISKGYHTINFRFRDEITFSPDKPFKLNKEFAANEVGKDFWNNASDNIIRLPAENKSNKLIISTWKWVKLNYYYTEVAIVSGHILPEEFIHLFQEICKGMIIKVENQYIELPNPKRIVLDEVDQIGVSYPLLYSSYTAGELFLSCLFHIVRNLKISMVVTGTTGHFEKSNQIVERAKTLANTTLNTDFCDVFGDRFITITGEGMNVQSLTASNINEMVPGVIQLDNETNTSVKTFSIDSNKLLGLVGFNSNQIYRPGLVLQLVQDNNIQKKYNKNILSLVKTAFHPVKNSEKSRIELVPITNQRTIPIHDSYNLLKDKPIEKTVVCTVDEFFNNKIIGNYLMPLYNPNKPDDNSLETLKYQKEECIYVKDQETVYALPYIKNVLIIAYNTKKFDELVSKNNVEFWNKLNEHISEFNNKNKRSKIKASITQFDSGLSCFMIDTIIASFQLFDKFNKKNISNFSDELNEIKETDFEILKNNLKAINNIFKNIINDYSENPNAFWEENFDANQIRKDKFNLIENKKNHKKVNQIPDLMVCWYSEFKSLISNFPDLQKNFKITRMPGDGFTGDWYIGIQKGSVSKSLGISVIDKICTKDQVHQRFVKGVGIPPKYGYFDNQIDFYLWSNSIQKLNDILEIHKDANLRSKIEDYQDIKQPLTTLFKHLLSLKNPDEGTIETKITSRIKPLIGCKK